MLPTDLPSLLMVAAPLWAVAGSVLAFALAAVPASRQHALGIACAVALLAGLSALYLLPSKASTTLYSHAALALLAGQIIAAPLFDRSRFAGLVAATLLGMLGVMHGVVGSLPALLPVLPHSGYVLVAIVAATTIGLWGSVSLPMHPARRAWRAPHAAPWRIVGTLLLAAAAMGLAILLEPTFTPATTLLAALSSALLSLLWARRVRHPQPLLRAAQGLLAGTLAGLMLVDGHAVALIAGLLAAIFVARGEAMAHALQLDDPAQYIGVLLLPAMVGLILPGADQLSVLADHLRWLGATLAVALVIAFVLWPLAKLTLGLAANPKRVREGLDSL